MRRPLSPPWKKPTRPREPSKRFCGPKWPARSTGESNWLTNSERAYKGDGGDVGPGPAIGDANKVNPADLLGGIKSNDPTNHQGWIENADMFKADTVHFDYDSSVVKAGEQPKVAAVAEGLKANSSGAVRVEGHCDERGTEEYNRSLGERRALALRDKLLTLGIDPKRVDTRSYGEDKPVDPGHNEAAYARNRRGEFILLLPK